MKDGIKLEVFLLLVGVFRIWKYYLVLGRVLLLIGLLGGGFCVLYYNYFMYICLLWYRSINFMV